MAAVTAAPTRAADLRPPEVAVTCNGGACDRWFAENVNVAFSWTVPEGETFWSESGCNGFSVTSDTAGAPYSCTVTVTADNGVTTVARTLSGSIKRDATPPTVASVTADRDADANGWYNHPLTVSGTGDDATSGIESCTSTTYSGPDASSAAADVTCTDNAGNTSKSKSFEFHYDATPPSVAGQPARPPDHAGWYNSSVAVSFTGSDSVSGVDSCTSASYSGPDGKGVAVSGSCRDKAGNSSSASVSLDYDSTSPEIVGAEPNRRPDSKGWYNHPVGTTFTSSDAGSGIDACTADPYGGPDGKGVEVTGTCRDKAGNSASTRFSLDYDATPPVVSGAKPARPPDRSGWYNRPITALFVGNDGVSGIDTCSTASYGGPDGKEIALEGSCRDNAGNTRAGKFSIDYDATPPVVSGAKPARPPDRNGWYNHPLKVAFIGADKVSGVASCTSTTYNGPNAAKAVVRGTCRDRAGNQTTGRTAIKYDATPPTLAALRVATGDRKVSLTWTASSDATEVEIIRTREGSAAPLRAQLVRRGPEGRFNDQNVANGVKYTYTVVVLDQAGNEARRSVTAVARPALFSPGDGETVTSAPTLAWKKDAKASYYNVQLFRGSQKVLTAWPVRPWFTLPSRWTYNGATFVLEPGRYRWYVWPGYGPRTKRDYGTPIGTSSFVLSQTLPAARKRRSL